MNLTLCLDPYSFNFDPNEVSLNGFNIYTDADGFTSPIATGIPASSLFSPPLGNCGSPLTITLYNIPEGATQILVIDYCDFTPISDDTNAKKALKGTDLPFSTDCCYALIDIPGDCGSFCSDCDIEFNNIELSPIGRIIAGNLQSSCGDVTDYVIGWYRNGDYSSPEVTTGFGTTFSYQYPHPLTTTTAPMVLDGMYEGIIHDVIINGTQYSNPQSGSGLGTPIPFQSCFETMVVNALECGNGSEPLPYTHKITLTAAGNGIPPGPVAATYLLENTTNYFAYNFKGYSIYDELEIKFISGDPNATTDPALYSQPIYLEKIKVGDDAGFTNSIYGLSILTNNIYPKEYAYNDNFKRVLTLTGLERNNGDKLEIKVTPNLDNPQTSWRLEMQCLDTFNCDLCTFDAPIPTQISEIEIDRTAGDTCHNQRPIFTTETCYHTGSDLWSTYAFSYVGPNGEQSFNLSNFFTTLPYTNCDFVRYAPIIACSPIGTGTITFEKTNNPSNGISSTGQQLGKIKFTFNNVNDYNHYKNELISAETTLQANIGPLVTNPTNPNYYATFELAIPQGSNTCGDGSSPVRYNIHRIAYPNIIYTENPGSNYWSIEIPMPEMLNGLTFSGCNDCIGAWYIGNTNDSIIDRVNSSSFHQNNQLNQTNNFSSKYIGPWAPGWLTVNASPQPTYIGKYTLSLYADVWKYSVETLPFIASPTSTTGWVTLPSLGGNPCPSYGDHLTYSNNTGQFLGYSCYYQIEFPDVDANPDDFKVYSRVTSNFGALVPSPGVLIYQYIGGTATVFQPQFFVGGTPNLIIDSW
jgi:hypothetical protein